jgi:hypothetical protein
MQATAGLAPDGRMIVNRAMDEAANYKRWARLSSQALHITTSGTDSTEQVQPGEGDGDSTCLVVLPVFMEMSCLLTCWQSVWQPSCICSTCTGPSGGAAACAYNSSRQKRAVLHSHAVAQALDAALCRECFTSPSAAYSLMT